MLLGNVLSPALNSAWLFNVLFNLELHCPRPGRLSQCRAVSQYQPHLVLGAKLLFPFYICNTETPSRDLVFA